MLEEILEDKANYITRAEASEFWFPTITGRIQKQLLPLMAVAL
jgi:hypothetical protein